MRGPTEYLERLTALAPVHDRAQIGGADTEWWTYEPTSRSANRAIDTVIAVHGFRGDHHGLELLVSHWDSVRWVIPDLPGFGASGSFENAAHGIAEYQHWLTTFVGQVRRPTGRTIVLGHSFGSIVVAAALGHGLPVDLAILVNPISAPALQGPRGLLTQLAIAYYQVGAVLPERLGRAWLSHPAIVRVMGSAMAKDPNRHIRRYVHDQHRRYFSRFASRDSLLHAFRTSVTNDVSEYATDITVPLLLVAAERDDITPVSAQVLVAAAAPNATLHVIPAVGHLIHYETPAAAAKLMKDFVNQA